MPQYEHDITKGALALLRACDPGQSPEDMLDRVLRLVQDFVPFDVSTFAEYETEPPPPDTNASGPLLVRGRYATDAGKLFAWPARWMVAPAGVMDWLQGKDVAVNSIDKYFLEHPQFQELRDNPITKTYLDRDARDFIVAVQREGNRPASTLTLARKHGITFSDDERRTLEALGIVDILRLIRTAYRAKAAAFHQRIRDLFAQHQHPETVAVEAVKHLCQGFAWDYVAIFRIAHSRRRFEIVEQCNASDKRLMVDRNYTQKFGDGVLGKVLRTGKAVRVQDTSDPSSDYKQIAPDARSCMCYPIILDGAVEWILDCESSEIGAFQYPDELELGALVSDAQKTVALWFEMRLNKALLENIDQGVIVVDQANRITRLNAQAAQLLGGTVDEATAAAYGGIVPREEVSRRIKGESLAQFGADEEARAVLVSGEVAAKPLRLRGLDAVERNVVASSRDTEDAFNRRVWRLTDPKVWDWVTALEYMRATVQGVAQQTRGPLLLANVLVDRARRVLPDDKSDLQGLLAKVCSSLAKTDITYDRLVNGLEAERRPAGTPVAVDIETVLKSFMITLPEDDRSAVTLDIDGNVPAAWADPDRVRFVLRSTVGYLLATRLADQRIRLRLSNDPGYVAMELDAPGLGGTGFPFSMAATDPVARAKTEAREATEHALPTVRKIIETSGGRLETLQKANGLTLRLTLPVATTHGEAETAGRLANA
jgi:PAS domain-containing protein